MGSNEVPRSGTGGACLVLWNCVLLGTRSGWRAWNLFCDCRRAPQPRCKPSPHLWVYLHLSALANASFLDGSRCSTQHLRADQYCHVASCCICLSPWHAHTMQTGLLNAWQKTFGNRVKTKVDERAWVRADDVVPIWQVPLRPLLSLDWSDKVDKSLCKRLTPASWLAADWGCLPLEWSCMGAWLGMAARMSLSPGGIRNLRSSEARSYWPASNDACRPGQSNGSLWNGSYCWVGTCREGTPCSNFSLTDKAQVQSKCAQKSMRCYQKVKQADIGWPAWSTHTCMAHALWNAMMNSRQKQCPREVHVFIPSFLHSFIPPFVCSFIHSFSTSLPLVRTALSSSLCVLTKTLCVHSGKTDPPKLSRDRQQDLPAGGTAQRSSSLTAVVRQTCMRRRARPCASCAPWMRSTMSRQQAALCRAPTSSRASSRAPGEPTAANKAGHIWASVLRATLTTMSRNRGKWRMSWAAAWRSGPTTSTAAWVATTDDMSGVGALSLLQAH